MEAGKSGYNMAPRAMIDDKNNKPLGNANDLQ